MWVNPPPVFPGELIEGARLTDVWSSLLKPLVPVLLCHPRLDPRVLSVQCRLQWDVVSDLWFLAVQGKQASPEFREGLSVGTTTSVLMLLLYNTIIAANNGREIPYVE